MVHCNTCNKDYEDSISFCSTCGAPLKESQPALPVTTDDQIVSQPKGETPLIEIRRESRFVGCLLNCKVYIDNMEVGQVGSGDSKRFEVPEGLHELYVKMNWSFAKSDPISFKLRQGDFLRFRFDFTFGTFASISGWWFLKMLFSGGKVIRIEQY